MVLLNASAVTSGILYLVLVVLFASRAGFRTSMFVAVVAEVLLDYYFLEPIHSLTLLGAQQWLAMVAFIASCFIVGRVAERARRNTMQAEQRREDVERLNALSQEMMLHGDAEGLVRDIPNLVQRIFSLDTVILFVRDRSESSGGRIYASSVSGAHMLPVFAALPDSWETPPELPDGLHPNNLIFGMKSVGVLAWKPAALSREVDTAVSAQVAIALTRSLAIEASARLEAERASDRLRSALTDSLTHELRTPLTAIRAAATTLLDGYGLDAESRHEFATIVEEESARLDTLIGQAIEMAQLDAESIRIERAPLYPHARSRAGRRRVTRANSRPPHSARRAGL